PVDSRGREVALVIVARLKLLLNQQEIRPRANAGNPQSDRPQRRRPSHASSSKLAARSTSSSDVYHPTLSRIVPKASSGVSPMAASLGEIVIAVLCHAEPVEEHRSGVRLSISAADTPGNTMLSVFGSRGERPPFTWSGSSAPL